jgi:hypothetical protein
MKFLAFVKLHLGDSDATLLNRLKPICLTEFTIWVSVFLVSFLY